MSFTPELNKSVNSGKSTESQTGCPYAYLTHGSLNNIRPHHLRQTFIGKWLISINYLGMKYLGRYWLFQFFGAIYPHVIAHFPAKRMIDRLWYGHQRTFKFLTTRLGKSASDYFLESGMHDFASKNSGICTFWMGSAPAVYQNTNVPLISDEYLAPSTAQNRRLFGEFMGTLSHGDKTRTKKRAIVESTLGNSTFVFSLEESIRKNLTTLLTRFENRESSLEDFCRDLIADLDSNAPGILDFTEKPLSCYLNSSEYRDTVINFFDIASDVISKLDPKATKLFDNISHFIRRVLLDNLKSIKNAPSTNIIKRYFILWGKELNKESIESLQDHYLKELGTIIVAIYDTTSLSLMWAISYIEDNSQLKKALIEDANTPIGKKKISLIDLVVFEAIRMGGSNPTALWRKVIKPFDLNIGNSKVHVRIGTMMWLDRRAANNDPKLFPEPSQFDPHNIENIFNSTEENLSSLMSRNRYEINSFSMVNTYNNPRKCPGRLFSVYIQSLILRFLYKNYLVSLRNNNVSLRKFSAMPKPSEAGLIKIRKL